jgi:hypothetical protein
MDGSIDQLIDSSTEGLFCLFFLQLIKQTRQTDKWIIYKEVNFLRAGSSQELTETTLFKGMIVSLKVLISM